MRTSVTTDEGGDDAAPTATTGRSTRQQPSVGAFTETQLEEIAHRSDVTVMKAVHDNVYTPWDARRVEEICYRIAQSTRRGVSEKELQEDNDICNFSSKYETIYSKLRDRMFVYDDENIKVMITLVRFRGMVELGDLSEDQARAYSADVALRSLAARAKSKSRS